jgi:SAM-dependent methyltransferase
MTDDLSEEFCRGSLARALGRPLEQPSPYWGARQTFDQVLLKAREALNSSDGTANNVFTLLYSILSELAVDEDWSNASGTEHVIKLIDELFMESKGTLSYYILSMFYATRVNSRLYYGSQDFSEPSINVGMGEGVSSSYVFGDRVMEVGSDLAIHDVVEASKRGGCRRYFAFDAMNIPFADGSFAAAISMNTVYHVNDKRRAITELARIVGPGGSIYFDDLQHAMLERPIPSLLSAAGFNIAGRAALDSAIKPQKIFTKPEYEELLRSSGFTSIDVRPMLSTPLFRLVYFLYDLEKLLGNGAYKVSADHDESLLKFLHKVVAPMLADDRRLAEQHGGALWFVSARKDGAPSFKVQTRCPECKTTIDAPYRCDCGISYPSVDGVPLLSQTYARLWQNTASA